MVNRKVWLVVFAYGGISSRLDLEGRNRTLLLTLVLRLSVTPKPHLEVKSLCTPSRI